MGNINPLNTPAKSGKTPSAPPPPSEEDIGDAPPPYSAIDPLNPPQPPDGFNTRNSTLPPIPPPPRNYAVNPPTQYERDPTEPTRTKTKCEKYKDIVVGILVFLAAFPVLFLNEGRAVRTAKALDEGSASVVILPSINTVLERNNNKLVYLTGPVNTSVALTDDLFGVYVYAVHLNRKVEMYQWVETNHTKEYADDVYHIEYNTSKNKKHVEATYTYEKKWSEELFESEDFNNPESHTNPKGMPYKSFNKTSELVRVGAFELPDVFKSEIRDFKVLYPMRKPGWDKDLVVDKEYIYNSFSPFNTQIGDIRISFQYAGLSQSNDPILGTPLHVTLIARQNGTSLSSYKTTSGGRIQPMFRTGVWTAEEMFTDEQKNNVYLTWGLRFLGWCLMIVGTKVASPTLFEVLSRVPALNYLLGHTTEVRGNNNNPCIVRFSAVFAISTSITLVTVAIAWLFFRPMLSLGIVAGAVVVVVIYRLIKAMKCCSTPDK